MNVSRKKERAKPYRRKRKKRNRRLPLLEGSAVTGKRVRALAGKKSYPTRRPVHSERGKLQGEKKKHVALGKLGEGGARKLN